MWQYLALGVLVLCSGWCLVTVTKWWWADHSFASGKRLIGSGYTVAGLSRLENAISLSPSEALFNDELASTYGQIALALLAQQEATAAAEFATSAIQLSNQVLQYNPRHLNFYKSRARMFVSLVALDANYVTQVLRTLEAAHELSPSDPKIEYNIGLIKQSLGDTEGAETAFLTAIKLKPNYLAAYDSLGDLYTQEKNWSAALQQYTYILQKLNPSDPLVASKAAAVIASQSATKQNDNKK